MDYEYTVLQKPERVCVFKLPNLTSAKGYYMEDWKEMIWEGGMKACLKGNTLIVYLVNKDKTVFGSAPIPVRTEEAVHRTVDSSRGYALRLQAANGKYAWIGMTFRDRNDAFDFTVCLQDFREQQDMEKNPDKLAKEFETKKDFSLQPGQKLKLNFGNNNASDKDHGFSEFQTEDQKLQEKKNLEFQNDFGNMGNPGNSVNNFGDFDFKDFNDWGKGNNPPQQNQFGLQQPNQPFQQPPPQNNQPNQKSVNLLDLF